MNEELKDRYNRKIGSIKTQGNKQVIYDRINRKVGSYDGTKTYDRNNKIVGQGNLSTLLINKNK